MVPDSNSFPASDPVELKLPLAAAPLATGVVVGNRYRVTNRIGAGAMGEVWAGQHLETNAAVAIKTMRVSTKVDHETIARFRREARLLERVRSGSVARVLEFLNDATYGLLLVMELVDGTALSEMLTDDRRITVEEAIEIAADLAIGLCDLHRVQVVHRDLKPSNVILRGSKSERRRAVIVDFGASRMVSANDGQDADDMMTAITCAGMAIGTIEYMAPEQMLSSRDVTAACDVYALGAMLYRMVAGRHVYGNISQGKLVRAKLSEDAPPLETGRTDALAKALERIVARALRRQSEERYPNAAPMAAELVALRDAGRSSVEAAPQCDATVDDGGDELPFPLVRRRRGTTAPPPVPAWYGGAHCRVGS